MEPWVQISHAVIVDAATAACLRHSPLINTSAKQMKLTTVTDKQRVQFSEQMLYHGSRA